MAIVINDFEVIAEPPAVRRDTAVREAESPPPPSVPDIERALQNVAERQARVEAH